MLSLKNNLNRAANLIKIHICEKKYKHRLKYVLEKCDDSEILVVVFSSFPGKSKAKYNYMRTLKDIKCNKLFILDDFGYEKKGSYYLAENGNFYVQDLVNDLILEIQRKLQLNYIITVGSSKGGTSAIYHGLRINADAIIAGAPQYFIGDYLNTDNHRKILLGIMNDVKFLNNFMKDMIYTSSNHNTKIYLHYSRNEHTYQEHITALVSDLRLTNFEVICDEKEYTEHSEVAIFFLNS